MFKTWVNNLEKEATKLEEDKIVIQKVEYRNTDRVEKSIQAQAYVQKRQVTKAYYERAKMKPFGIGQSFDDLKTNAAITTVQRENVWQPFYEV